jgi:hypothetical protein
MLSLCYIQCLNSLRNYRLRSHQNAQKDLEIGEPSGNKVTFGSGWMTNQPISYPSDHIAYPSNPNLVPYVTGYRISTRGSRGYQIFLHSSVRSANFVL